MSGVIKTPLCHLQVASDNSRQSYRQRAKRGQVHLGGDYGIDISDDNNIISSSNGIKEGNAAEFATLPESDYIGNWLGAISHTPELRNDATAC